MDQHGEKEERKGDDVDDAAAEGDMKKNNHEEAEETLGALKAKEAEVVGDDAEETTALPPLLVHPCSLLQLLLRACAGCLDLHGYCSDGDNHTKPAAADVPAAAAAAAAADSPQEGDDLLQGGSDTAASVEVVVTDQVRRAVRGRTPPGPPREGPGGDGGQHN